jgi:outer membrane receptor protein involved in Fe transport
MTILKMQFVRRLALTLSLLAALPFSGSAQQALTGTITGTVTDASGAAVPDAQVTARNINTGLERTTQSGELGIYTLTLLPVGEYELTAKKTGFNDLKVGPVRVGVGQSISAELQLAVGTAATQIDVDASVSAVETTRTSVASSVDNSQIANLGLNGRDFLKFLLLTPGVTTDVRTGDLSFGGLRGTLNNLQVDGSDNNNNFYGQALGRTGTGRAPYQFSVDSVEEFQINTSTYSAEFGRAGGAVTNVVTKSGTNDFHGSAFEYFRDRYMNANTWINNSRGIPRQPFHVNQFGGTVGGPVVKNKDFFFFNYDGQRRHLPNPVFLGVPIPAALADPANQSKIQLLQSKLAPYQLAYDQDVYLVKNDWQISDKHRLSGRYNRQKFSGVGLESSGNQVAYEHSGTAYVKTDTISTSLASVFSPRWINEFRFQYLRDDEPSEAYSTGPETVLRESNTTVLSFGASSITPRYANIKGIQFGDNMTHVSGRHTFKVGADINHNQIENYFAGNVRGSYTFNSYADFFANRPASFIQAFPGEGTPGFTTKPDFTELGFYVQDEFRPTPKLTLNFGVRYDLALLTHPPVKNPDPQLASFGLDTSKLDNDTNNFGPRFGFAYKPLSSDKVVIRGGYGMFYGRTPQILVSTAYNQNGISAASLTFTGAAIPPYPANFNSQPSGGTAAVPSILLFDPNYVLPLVFQGSIGTEFEVSRNTTISVNYLNVHGEHLTRTRDVNLFPAVPVSVTLPDVGGRTLLRYPGPQGSPLRPMSHFARAEVFESGANSFYNGFTLAFRRRFATHYQVNLSYTYAKAIDDVADFTSVVPFNSIDEGKMPFYPTAPGLDRGPSINDQRHRVVTNFVWNLDYFHGLKSKAARIVIDGWTLSGIIFAQTGQPYSNAVGGDVNNDTNSFTDRAPQDARNTNYAPTISNWDLTVRKAFPIYRERVHFQIGLDAFNAFNQGNFLSTNVRTGKYNFTPANGVFTLTNNFGTYASQTLDNRVLQVSGKIMF